MVNVIIFGTGKTCRIIESGLNETVNILAYCDNDKTKWNTLFNNKVIIPPEDIIKFNYDYIIIASQYNQSIYEQLLSMRINKEYIFQFLLYRSFLKNPIKENIKKVTSCVNDLQVLITGISYAEKGIEASLLTRKAFNFAKASQDLYFDYKIVKHLLNNYSQKLNKVKYAIISLCYYTFEYDLSLSAMQVRTVLYHEALGCKHNIKNIDEIYKNRMINENIANELMKFTASNKLDINWMNSEKNIYILDEEKGKNQALKDGNKNYPETVKENIFIFKKYLKLLKEYDIKPIVVVCPVSNFYAKHFNTKLKQEFYKVINEVQKEEEFQLLDYFESNEFNEDDFYDVSHLNKQGSKKFTEILNKTIDW